MVRKERVIDKQIRVRQKNLLELILTQELEDKIEYGVEVENHNNLEIAEIKELLNKLAKEPVYEDTLDGQLEGLEAEAIVAINKLLQELTAKTGLNYATIDTLFRNTSDNKQVHFTPVNRNMQGESWTTSEDEKLRRRFGDFLRARATYHRRTPGAIRARVKQQVVGE